jgi:hypothetical protein
MLNKNDPLIGAVQEVMKKNQAERDAVNLVNEKFGVEDRKALPRENQAAWDAAYKTVLTEGVEALDELAPDTLMNYRNKRRIQVGATLRNMAKNWETKKTGEGASNFIKNSAEKAAKHAKMIKLAGDKIEGKKGVVAAKRPKKRLEEEELDEEKIKMYGIPNKVKPKGRGGKLRKGEQKAIDVTNAFFGRMDALKKGNVKAAGNVTKAQIKKMHSEENDIDHPNKRKLDVAEPYGDLTSADFKKLRSMKESDVTTPSSMNIKKPDYAPAGTTPDYAKDKEQTVNRRVKTSLPAGTIKEAVVNKIMKKLAEKKKENLSFNNRHGLSVTASAEKQAVADQLNEKVGNPQLIAQARERANRAKLAQSRMRPDVDAAALKNMRDARTDATAQAAAQTAFNTALPNPKMTGTGALRPRPVRSNAMTGTGALRPPVVAKKNIPVSGGARPEVVAKNTPTAKPGAAQSAFDKMQAAKPKSFEFTDAEKKGKVSKERLTQFYKEKGIKSSGKSSQDLRTFMNAATNKTINTKGVAATDLQKTNQSRLQALAPSNAQAQRMRPAGSPTTTQNVSTVPKPTVRNSTLAAPSAMANRPNVQPVRNSTLAAPSAMAAAAPKVDARKQGLGQIISPNAAGERSNFAGPPTRTPNASQNLSRGKPATFGPK